MKECFTQELQVELIGCVDKVFEIYGGIDRAEFIVKGSIRIAFSQSLKFFSDYRFPCIGATDHVVHLSQESRATLYKVSRLPSLLKVKQHEVARRLANVAAGMSVIANKCYSSWREVVLTNT